MIELLLYLHYKSASRSYYELQAKADGSIDIAQLTVHVEPFFIRLTNIGLRLLIADGDIGDVGILWMPDELPPGLVYGLP
tara:strand:+ start:48278 stop:48517 length:240 start_codon:yes stop_codon:yes gene_type:complete